MKDYFGNKLSIEDIVVINITSVIPNCLMNGKIVEIIDDFDDSDLGIAKIHLIYGDSGKEEFVYRVGKFTIKPLQQGLCDKNEEQITKKYQDAINKYAKFSEDSELLERIESFFEDKD